MSDDTVRIDASLPYKVWQAQSGVWIGVCDALQVTVQADTWAELMEAIIDGLEMIFQDLLNSGELEQFLAEQGWQARGPYDVDTKFDVPFIPELVESS